MWEGVKGGGVWNTVGGGSGGLVGYGKSKWMVDREVIKEECIMGRCNKDDGSNIDDGTMDEWMVWMAWKGWNVWME